MKRNPNLMIRPSRAADLQDICKMVHALAAHHGDCAEVTADHLMFLTQGPRPWMDLLLAEMEGQPLGYAALMRKVQLHKPRRILELAHLYVTEEARGQGVGRALIDASCERARNSKCEFVSLGVQPDNPNAISMYLACGFEVRVRPSTTMVLAL